MHQVLHSFPYVSVPCTETISLSILFIPSIKFASTFDNLYAGHVYFFLNLTNGDAIRLNGQF